MAGDQRTARKDPAARLGADETEYLLRRICEDAGTAAHGRAAAGLAVPVSLPARDRIDDTQAGGTRGGDTRGGGAANRGGEGGRRLCLRQRLLGLRLRPGLSLRRRSLRPGSAN